MDNKQLSGEEFFADFLQKQSIAFRNTLMQKLEIEHKTEMTNFENRMQYFLNRIYLEHKTKKDLAGKRTCLGREKLNELDIGFLSKYFRLPITSVEEIEIEDDDFSQNPNKHKEYYVTFGGYEDLYQKIRDLEEEIKRLKSQ